MTLYNIMLTFYGMFRWLFIDFVFCYSGVLPDDKAVAGKLDPDGFPPVGAYLQEGDPFYW